jgi:hypothetical protein
MKNRYAPNEFQPEPQEQGLLAPPGQKPPTALGAGTPPSGGDGPGDDDYAALKRRRARRLRVLGILFVAVPASLLVLSLIVGAAPFVVLAAGATLAAAGLHRVRGFIARTTKRRIGLYTSR